jgi:hypothetical protein
MKIKNWTIRHKKDSNYSFFNKTTKEKIDATFSHFFCRTAYNNYSAAVYNTSDDRTILVHQKFSRNTSEEPKIFTKKEWDDLIDKIEDFSDLQALTYVLDRFFGHSISKED